MKTGKTLVELAQEITRQKDNRIDFISNTRNTEMVLPHDGSAGTALAIPDHGAFPLNDLAHRQVGAYAGIPAAYYDRMRETHPSLLAQNVNTWFADKGENRMFRALDGRVRAFLSDRYRPLENFDLAEAVLPVLQDMEVELVSCEITERRLYLKVVDKRINRDIPSGRKLGDGSHVFFDTVSPALVISNSEVGSGALSVESGIWTRLCTNLAISTQHSMRKYHVGGRHEISEGLTHLLTDETRRATDKAVWMQVRDVVKGAFDEAVFDARLDDLRGLAAQPIVGDVTKVVDLAARTLDIREMEKPSILRHLAEGGDLTRYGLFNAITRTAEDVADYDRATEFERMGGQLIDLSASDWKKIAEAA